MDHCLSRRFSPGSLIKSKQDSLLFGIGGIIYGIGLYAVLRTDEYETMPSGQRNETSDGSFDRLRDRDRRSFFYPLTIIYFFFVSSGLTSHGINAFLPAFLVAVYAYSFDLMGVHVGAESMANVYFAVMLIAGGVLQLYLGGLLDRYDSRPILIGCMAVATVGLVVLAAVDLAPLALAGVIVILGAGLYGVNPARDALISDLSPPEYEGRMFGYLFTATSLVGAAFPTIIGYLLGIIGMRQGFLIAMLYSDRMYVPETEADASTTPSD